MKRANRKLTLTRETVQELESIEGGMFSVRTCDPCTATCPVNCSSYCTSQPECRTFDCTWIIV